MPHVPLTNLLPHGFCHRSAPDLQLGKDCLLVLADVSTAGETDLSVTFEQQQQEEEKDVGVVNEGDADVSWRGMQDGPCSR